MEISKKYILYSILQELLSSLAPFAAIVMPKQFIIDELLGKQRIDVILNYVSILVLCNFVTTAVCSWLRIGVLF